MIIITFITVFYLFINAITFTAKLPSFYVLIMVALWRVYVWEVITCIKGFNCAKITNIDQAKT